MQPLKRWQEPLYALGSLGSYTLNNLVLTWILFFYHPSEAEAASTGATFFVSAAAASATWIVARLVDGVCDLPIARWTDNLHSRWGRRRPMIAAGLLPLAASFILIWYPPVPEAHWLNAAWMAFFGSAFFFSYTFVVVPYLALLSELAPDGASRLRLASWQTIFGVLGSAIVAVATPQLVKQGYQRTAWLFLGPSLLCFLGPILAAREPASDPPAAGSPPSEVPSLRSTVSAALANRAFSTYMLSVVTFYMGLQLFLIGQPYIVTAVMGLDKDRISALNLGSFLAMPFALWAFNHLSRRHGAKRAFRLAILALAVIMLLYPLTWTRLRLPLPPLAMGAILHVLAGYSLAAIITVLNAFPAEIAYRDRMETGQYRAGMYFAVQGVLNQTVAALAGVMTVQLTTHLGSSVARPYGSLALTPIAALLCFAGWALFARYPLGGPPTGEQADAAGN